MPAKTDFTTDQWQAIRNAPQLVALAAAAAGNSGLFGSLSEGMATASSIAEAVRGDQPLLREVFDKDEMRAAQDQIRGMLKSVTDKSSLNSVLQGAAVDAVRTAMAALAAKGATSESEAFQSFLSGVADKVANASKEGGFLGFGGERISEGEREFIARLKSILGGTAA
jgi:hypothetical protein